MTAGDSAPNGRCPVYVAANGSQFTRLSAHVEPETGVTVSEYPAERRAVLHLGERWRDSLDVYLGAAELARLIDVLNAAYTRVARRPYEEEPAPVSGSA